MPDPAERNDWLDDDTDMDSVTVTLTNSLPKLRQFRDKLDRRRQKQPTVVIVDDEDGYDVRGDQ